jgi:hypothetical protein
MNFIAWRPRPNQAIEAIATRFTPDKLGPKYPWRFCHQGLAAVRKVLRTSDQETSAGTFEMPAEKTLQLQLGA